MKRTLFSIRPLAVFALLAFTCLQANATIHTVQVSNFAFTPSALGSVNVGDTIRWQWVSGSHNTTSQSVPSGASIWVSPITSSHPTFDYIITAAGNYSYNCTIHPSSMVGSFTAAPPCNLSLNWPTDTNACGNAVTLDAGNANTNSTYAWSDGSHAQTNVISNDGTYAVTVSNSNCSVTSSTSVHLHANPTVILTQNVVRCGSYVIDASNGGAGQYIWNDAHFYDKDTVLFSGVYSVTLTDANNCTTTKSTSVTIHDNPVVSLGNDTSKCSGTITLNAGNAGSSFIWSDHSSSQTLTATTSGTYSVTVTNSNNCFSSDTINVSIGAPVVNLGNDTTACDSFFVINAGNAGGTYLWSDAHRYQRDTISVSGTYSVTVTLTGGCTATDIINVVFHTKPVVDLGPERTTCGITTLDAGNPGAQYMWTTGDTTETIAISSAGGIYGVTVTANGCHNDDRVILDPCTGIDELAFGTVNLYPNPSEGHFSLVMEQSTATDMNMEITSVTGQKVWTINHENATGKYVRDFNLSYLAKGVYYLRLVSGKDVTVKRIVLQ